MWHFDRIDDNIWKYTKHKFARFIPYTIISVVAGYILMFSYNTSVYRHLKSILVMIKFGYIFDNICIRESNICSGRSLCEKEVFKRRKY